MSTLYVLRRELTSFVCAPQMYAIAAAYLVLSGIFMLSILISSEVPDLAQYCSNIANTLIVLVPVVAMRAFAEERRNGGLDIVLSWRIQRSSLVLGKFGASTLYVWVLVSSIWLYYHLIGGVAQIQFGRTLGGYVGLLLMSMAFTALSLMVSARATSAAGAAFVGFGLLLFLWILEYAPGAIGEHLQSLGPAQHFDSFPKGVLYWDDVAYFVILTVVGLGLAVAVLERDRPGSRLPSLARWGAAVGAGTALVFATVAATGDVRGQVDLTSSKQNTITETTRDVIDRVTESGKPVRVTGFSPPLGQEADDLRNLVKQYRAAGAKMSLTIIDPDSQPGKASAAGVTGYGQAVVTLGSSREILANPAQGSLTSALLRLASPTRPQACFTVGHGERDIVDKDANGVENLAGALRYIGYEIKQLGLAAPGASSAIERCAIVVIAGPRYPFLAEEIGLLGDYTASEGRLLVAADVHAPEVLDQLDEVLHPWGVSLGRQAVSDKAALAGDPTSVAALDYGSGTSPVVARLHEDDVPVVFTNAVAIEAGDEAVEAGAFSELVQSSRASWTGADDDRRDGPFVLAGIVDWSRLEDGNGQSEVARTRIGLLGTVEVLANQHIDVLGNRRFATNLVQWVAQKDDLISAGRPPVGFNKVVLTTDQKNRLVRQGIAIPSLLSLVPVPITLLRLRRG